MRVNLLKQILAVPTCSGHEDVMVEFLINHVRQGGVGQRGTCVVDEWNNVFIRKGNAAICPCLAAHIDTVHPLCAVRVIEQDGIIFGVDKHGQRAGIGADDKAGVYARH